MRSQDRATPSRRSVALSTSGLLIAAALSIIAAPVGAQASLDGCPHGQGFWKNHADLWPTDTLTLGDEAYGSSELLGLLATPTKGDASMILAHQLIAAKLNVAGGAVEAPFGLAIADADALLATYPGTLPYEVKGAHTLWDATRDLMLATAETLDALNQDDDRAACGTPPGETAANAAVSATGYTSATGRPTFDINITSDGTEAASGVTFTLDVSVIDPAEAEGGWDLRVNTTHPDIHRTNIGCLSVTLNETTLSATCQVLLAMAPGDWVDLSLIGSGWDGQGLTLDVAITADEDADPADDQASASLGA